MKKLIVTLLLMVSVISQPIGVMQATEGGTVYLDLDFDSGEIVKDKTGWAINTPVAKEIDGVSTAQITNTSSGYAYYTFEMKNMTLKGDLVIETRVKQSTSNTFLIKGFMNSGASLGYAHLMSRYIDPSLGPVWVNADKTSVIMDNYETDINSDEPDMEKGWDTIYIHVNTQDGKYRAYVNNSGYYTEGTFEGNNDNFLHSIRFGLPNVGARDPQPYVYIDYIKIYSADLLNLPEPGIQSIAKEANFDTYETGANLRKTLFGYATDDNTLAETVADPADNDNKCARLYAADGAPFAARFLSSALFGKKASVEFSAFLPQNADADIFTLYSDTSSLASVNGAADGTLSFGSTSCEADLSKWTDIRYEINLENSVDNVLCYINDKLAATKTLLGNKLLGFRFGIPSGNNQGLYLDNIRFYTDDGLCRITPSKKSGKVQYGDLIMLSSSDSSAAIYYTTDGTKPTQNSELYDGGIPVDKNGMIIKAAGYSDGAWGRIYTFGSYTLNSVDGIIITKIKPDETVVTDGCVSADFNLLNTEADRSVEFILGLYDEGKLIGLKSENVVLAEGLNNHKISFIAPEYSYKSPEIRAFVWDSLNGGRIYCEYVTNLQQGEGIPAASASFEEAPVLENVKYSLNSTEALVTVSGNVKNPAKDQDISIVMSAADNGEICALTQSYTDADGVFEVSVPVRDDIKGGYYNICVGGRKIDARTSGSVYYVDDIQRAEGVSKINAAAKSDIISLIEELCANDVLDIDILNEEYVLNKEAVGNIIYNTKQKKVFSSIEEVSHAFYEAIAVNAVMNAESEGYFKIILENKDAFSFMKDSKYYFDETVDLTAGSKALGEQIKNLPEDIYAFEEAYKTAYALTLLNSAERSEISDILSEYNDIFSLSLDGDYKNVSEYEVSKALYKMEFKNISSVKAAFDQRVAQLKAEKNDNSSSGRPSGGGGGRDTGYKNNNINIQEGIVTPIKREDKFIDVNSAHWAYDAIEALAEKGIVKGFEDKTFKPDSGVTRAEFVTMLTAAFGLEETEGEEKFSDVKKTDWYFKYVMAAYEKGIVSGDGEKFNPSALISREDMAVIVYRLIAEDKSDEKNELSFKDKDLISEYAKEAVAYISSKGVISGFEDLTFRPDDTLTRAQSARVIDAVISQ